jgi:chromosome partitioning protein
MPATTISIATHKGGTGKTVTAMAVSAGLARAGKRTLLVDLDPQGHSTIGLGLELGNNPLTVRDVFTDPTTTSVPNIIRQSHINGLDVLPSNIRLERAAYLIYTRPKREDVLRKSLQPVISDYDYVVIDCPPSLGPLTESAIAAADVTLIPCQMEARAADGLVDLLEVVHIIKGDSFDRWRILLTRVDTRRTVTNEVVLESLAPWKDKILATTIPQSEPLNQAQIQRTDIFTFDGKSKGALAYQSLIDAELMRI